jgi:hypothetical protein
MVMVSYHRRPGVPSDSDDVSFDASPVYHPAVMMHPSTLAHRPTVMMQESTLARRIVQR